MSSSYNMNFGYFKIKSLARRTLNLRDLTVVCDITLDVI